MYPHLAFSHDQFALCYRAYTSALLDIQYRKDRTDCAPPGDNTCLVVALRIIEASANGERDLLSLKRFALVDLMRH
jgi:hypothetical protein